MKPAPPPVPFAFAKFSGSGNDFIVLDHRDRWCADPAELARRACRRGLSIGADGLLLLEPAAPPAHFAMRIINSDGSEPTMCGNGARCLARFAYLEKLAPAEMLFTTGAGPVRAWILPDGQVKISLTYAVEIDHDRVINLDSEMRRVDFLQTGVPHAVLEVEDLEATDVAGLGARIRANDAFAPHGTNVNFIHQVNNNTIRIRTFERGVEGETLACGTGSVASAIAAAIRNEIVPPVNVITRGGETLTVFFTLTGTGVSDLHLQGSARLVYRGVAAEY